MKTEEKKKSPLQKAIALVMKEDEMNIPLMARVYGVPGTTLRGWIEKGVLNSEVTHKIMLRAKEIISREMLDFAEGGE